ncbi:MAG: hypothetical protein IKH27_04280 [Oscillospiraceae bacterium]|nr:hypothetical protein [Oscillospiraceae bacterium]
MRMTNEEFQAEVFRRSAAYQREHTRRIRIMTRAAAAFAGCLLLTVGVGVAVSRNGAMRANETATTSGVFYDGNAVKDAESSACEAEGAADNCEGSAEDGFDFTNGQNDAVSSAEDADSLAGISPENGGKQDRDPLEISGEDSFADPKHAVFVKKTAAEIMERYGLDAMPETLHGFPLMKMYNAANYEDQEPGFIVSETDPELILSDENTFLYKSREGARQELTVKLYTAHSDDAPVSYAVTSDPEAEEREEIALFTFRGLSVQMRAYNMDHESLECIVEDMTEYLEEHKHSG